jgi:phosphoribosylformylglycinamidine (FGAM) synthase-like amidotransferase family enzyme
MGKMPATDMASAHMEFPFAEAVPQREESEGLEEEIAKQKPKVLIPKGLGTNSHEELGYVFRLAGADVDYVHWNELIENPSMLDNYQGLGLPGGFTMGDQLGAGQSLKNRIKESGLRDKLAEKLEDETFPVYSVCNCLQLLAKLDLMPVPIGTVANDSGKHETKEWDMTVNASNDSIWLSRLHDYEGPIFAPISHGEGRIYIPEEHLETVRETNLTALAYTRGHMCRFYESSRGDRYNPNGSTDDLAGIAWKNNLVLFPHFERLHHNFQRQDRQYVIETGGGIMAEYEPTKLMFGAAVGFMKEQMKKKQGPQENPE